jgi:hypothetical protein
MLEGQVAVLTSGVLSANEVVQLLDELRSSSLYRDDQNSYILYPNKRLPSFLKKNNINPDDVKRINLLTELVAKGDKRIITTDKKGGFHFNASFNNADFLRETLLNLKKESNFEVNDTDIQSIENVYEQIFDHQSFTGRSGTFYKYEGLGCIYWHMVSKLLLAIGENISWATEKHEDKSILNALKKHYAEVKAGIGAHKSPAEYGSFPFDPYSHTPTMAGVQQPGMTGQVKEDVISRFFELGIAVKQGCIEIHPENVNFAEFIQPTDPNASPYLSFSYCSVPFIYENDRNKGFEIVYTDKQTQQTEGYLFDKQQSEGIFSRSKNILKVIVHF